MLSFRDCDKTTQRNIHVTLIDELANTQVQFFAKSYLRLI